MRKQSGPSALGFDRYDKRRLSKTLQEVKDKRTYVRLLAVSMVAEGKDINGVARMIHKSRQVIYNWVHRYVKSHQPASLFDAPRSGRPAAAPGITPKRILQALKHTPFSLGYNAQVWTVALLAGHLSQRYGCEIGPFTLYRRMKQIGLRCKRPRYVYEEKDPHRTQKKGPLSES